MLPASAPSAERALTERRAASSIQRRIPVSPPLSAKADVAPVYRYRHSSTRRGNLSLCRCPVPPLGGQCIPDPGNHDTNASAAIPIHIVAILPQPGDQIPRLATRIADDIAIGRSARCRDCWLSSQACPSGIRGSGRATICTNDPRRPGQQHPCLSRRR